MGFFLSKSTNKGKGNGKGKPDDGGSNILSKSLSKSLSGAYRRNSAKRVGGTMARSSSFEDQSHTGFRRASSTATFDEMDSTSSTMFIASALARITDPTGYISNTGGSGVNFIRRKSCLKKHFSTSDFDITDCQVGPSLSESRRKNVSFDVVEVREYMPSISHNPTVRDGIAVELGWEIKSSMKMQFEDFESSRPPPVKSELELLLTQEDRLRILRAGGHSTSVIQKAMDATRKGRNHRLQTLKKIRAEDRKMEGKLRKLNLAKLSELEMECSERTSVSSVG